MLSQSTIHTTLSKHKQVSSANLLTTPVILDIINESESIQDNIIMDVLHIREEIVNNAMDICYKNYLEKQAIRFFVQCSYEAWMKILGLNFYQHDDRSEFYQKMPNIGQDRHPIPSIPDTWAANSTQISDPLYREYDADINDNDDYTHKVSYTITAPSEKSVNRSLRISRITDLDEHVDDSTSECYLGKYMIPEEAPDIISVPNPSEVSFEDRESVESISKQTSFFTSIAISTTKDNGVQPILSRIIPHKPQKIIKAKIPHACNDMQHPKSVRLEDLPPVRAPATFKYNIYTEEERKRLENKKKPN